LTVITCANDPESVPGIDLKNFDPIHEFEVPEYEFQKLALPPLLRVLDFIQSRGFNEVILSTPGPLGICGLIAARLLGLRAVSIYHTDFPKYVKILTGDSLLETVAWRSMHWFYNQCDLVYVNSRHYREIWIERGIHPDKLAILPRGMDTGFFHPGKRKASLWQDLGAAEGELILLYAGRVSREKDLHLLIEADRRLRAEGHRFRIAIVGDGPFLPDLKRAIPTGIFTGYRQGDDLAEAYASADIFVFPSTTDTYGNVVVEAMASGLPCVVSDVGGPCDLVEEDVNGFVTKGLDAEDFTAGIARLLDDPDKLQTMKKAARSTVAKRTWSKALEQFWQQSEE
jgi:glycosyltransferase involved in cell wall biosynthesis